MAEIRTILDNSENPIYPETKVEAITDNSGVSLQTLLNNKQNGLISGTNIKSVNGNTLLGSGNLVIPTGASIDDTTTATDKVWSSSKTSTELGGKQATLVSGTNIKTVNGNSLVGSGDVVVTSTDPDIEKIIFESSNSCFYVTKTDRKITDITYYRCSDAKVDNVAIAVNSVITAGPHTFTATVSDDHAAIIITTQLNS